MKRPHPEIRSPTPLPIVTSTIFDSSKHRKDPKLPPSSRRLLLLARHCHCTVPSFSAALLLTTYLLYILWQQQWISILSSSSSSPYCRDHSTSQPQSRLILTASHLRSGLEGELRLRIIAHNLKLLYEDHRIGPPIRSIVIFSHDDNDDASILDALRTWKAGPAKGLVDRIKLVPNDPVNVDVSKWMSALEPTERSYTSSQTLLLNDSFLLLRPLPPSLWHCPTVCGLAWTAPPDDASRHFQSYLRVLSPCELERFRTFVRGGEHMNSVQEVIQRWEVDLSWARGARAAFEYGGGHPDEDAVQRRLIGEGFPAIKLKKFFETEDPWMRTRWEEEEMGGERVSPSLDLKVYRGRNHDLNHLTDEELREHFASFGWKENRIYSRLPLVMKGWLREELETLPNGNGKEVLDILEDCLTMLNKGNQPTDR